LPQTDQSVASHTSSLQFAFPGESAAIPAARDRILDFLRERGVHEPEEIDILVALQEALINAVIHGCKNDPSQVVRCSIGMEPQAVTIVIHDPGAGFDIATSTDLSEDGTNLTQHGRGILLMRGLMDEVSYSNHGSQLKLTKRLPKP